MTLRTFILGTTLALLIGTAVTAAVITQINPAQASWLVYILLFASFFTASTGLLSLIGYGLRRIILQDNQFAPYTVRISLRQGLLLSTFATSLLLLQLLRLYRWWVAVLCIVFLITFELVFLSYDKANQRSRSVAGHTKSTAEPSAAGKTTD